MRQNTQQRKSEGFTIIEVMIVLAIAGLIMLIVFLAVPALQRNSHNTARKNDISRVASGVNDWISNSNGSTFSSAAIPTVINDAGSLSQYNLTTTNLTTAAAPQSALAADGTKLDSVVIVTGGQCDTAVTGAVVKGTSRQMAIQYELETSDGKGNPVCLNI